MAWDFETEPEFEAKLEWIRQFVAERIEPLDLIYPHRAVPPARRRDRARWCSRCRRRSGRRASGPRTSVPSSAARASAS